VVFNKSRPDDDNARIWAGTRCANTAEDAELLMIRDWKGAFPESDRWHNHRVEAREISKQELGLLVSTARSKDEILSE
jgi:hypothetical protein